MRCEALDNLTPSENGAAAFSVLMDATAVIECLPYLTTDADRCTELLTQAAEALHDCQDYGDQMRLVIVNAALTYLRLDH